jgi:hypothetical protein
LAGFGAAPQWGPGQSPEKKKAPYREAIGAFMPYREAIGMFFLKNIQPKKTRMLLQPIFGGLFDVIE